MKQRTIESEWIDDCFVPDNPFRYSIYLDKQAGGFRIVDQQLREPYQVYLFDNGPDYPHDGRYHIRLNDKARVRFGCQEESDGEHRWWSSGRWQTIDLKSKVVD